jgi:hypothetical protein
LGTVAAVAEPEVRIRSISAGREGVEDLEEHPVSAVQLVGGMDEDQSVTAHVRPP